MDSLVSHQLGNFTNNKSVDQLIPLPILYWPMGDQNSSEQGKVQHIF
jgi:hypothetical protein